MELKYILIYRKISYKYDVFSLTELIIMTDFQIYKLSLKV